MTTNSANTANAAIAKGSRRDQRRTIAADRPATLQLDNVSYAYTKGGKRVLKNRSATISKPAKVHAITEPSGSRQNPRCYH